MDAVGPGLLAQVRRLVPGRRVAVLNSGAGNWQEYRGRLRQASRSGSRPADRRAGGHFFRQSRLRVGHDPLCSSGAAGWPGCLQTAAGSALGRMVLRLGRHFGFRTINVVRRRELAEELLHAGGDAAVCTADEGIEERVKTITGGQGLPMPWTPWEATTGSAAARSWPAAAGSWFTAPFPESRCPSIPGP